MEGGDGDGLGDWDFCDGSLVEEGKGGLGDLKDNALKEALAFGGTAFLDLDGDGSLVEGGVEGGEVFDGSLVEGAFEETSFLDLDGDDSLVEVGKGGSLVEGGGFFDGSLVEVKKGSLGVFDSLEAAFLDLDGDGSLVDVGSGRSLVEGGGFFDDSLVDVGEGGLGVFDSLEATFDLGGSGVVGGKTYQDKKPTSSYFYCLHNQLTMLIL